MAEESDTKALVKTLVPRIFKAALWGIFTYVLVYYPTMLIYSVAPIPLGYNQLFYLFVGVAVFFAVVTKLFSGTILEYAFSIARALIMIIYFIHIFNGGIISFTMPMSEVTVNIVVDLRVLLVMFLSVNLLAIGKSLLQVVDLLAKKVETSQFAMQ